MVPRDKNYCFGVFDAKGTVKVLASLFEEILTKTNEENVETEENKEENEEEPIEETEEKSEENEEEPIEEGPVMVSEGETVSAKTRQFHQAGWGR